MTNQKKIEVISMRERLVSAATELFALHGFEGVSVRDIGKKVGAHFSNVRSLFGGKDELYQICIGKHGQSRLGICKEFLERAPNTIEQARLQLELTTSRMFECHSQNPYASLLVLREVESRSSRSDETLKRTLFSSRMIIVSFFGVCRSKGYLNSESDDEFLSTAYYGIINQYMRTEALRKRLAGAKKLSCRSYRDELSRKVTDLFLGENRKFS